MAASRGHGAFAPQSEALPPTCPPSQKKKWPKSAILDKCLDFCPLVNAFCPLDAPQLFFSGTATDYIVSFYCGVRHLCCFWFLHYYSSVQLFWNMIRYTFSGTVLHPFIAKFFLSSKKKTNKQTKNSCLKSFVDVLLSHFLNSSIIQVVSKWLVLQLVNV